MDAPAPKFQRFRKILKSKQGKNFLTFLVFLALSGVLWSVLSINEEETVDLRLPVRLDNVPDSVTVISAVPDFLNVSVKSKGSQLVKLKLSSEPEVVIDFRRYAKKNYLRLNEAEIKSLARSALSGASVFLVSPDSFSIAYTHNKGTLLPVVIQSDISSGPQSSIVGKPKANTDSVRVFSLSALPSSIISVKTEDIRLTGLRSDTTVKARMIAPARTRVIPDSILVHIKVEPVIVKTRKIVIEPINVPAGMRLITFPAQIDVIYTVPMSQYSHTNPHFVVTADYRSIRPETGSRKVRIKLSNVPTTLDNVYLAADSVEYIIEK